MMRRVPVCCRFYLFSVAVVSDASFSENFYGLRRVSRDGSDSAISAADTQVVSDKVRHLTRAEKRRSLLFLVSPFVVLCCA